MRTGILPLLKKKKKKEGKFKLVTRDVSVMHIILKNFISYKGCLVAKYSGLLISSKLFG
jgi:hypothetical protein